MQKHSVRESKRAKHVSLNMSVRDGLVVVVPYGFNYSKIPNLLQRKKLWIENAYRRIEKQRSIIRPAPSGTLPKEIVLQAISDKYLVEYAPKATYRVKVMEDGNNMILVSGAIRKHSICKAALQKWIHYKAKKHLIPWLKMVSEEMDLPFSRPTVRNQRSRWASCSKQKNISINQKLLFFPNHLVRYIFIHELCHTVHLNHSPAFWKLVRQKEPKCEIYKKELRTAGQYVPAWHKSI